MKLLQLLPAEETDAYYARLMRTKGSQPFILEEADRAARAKALAKHLASRSVIALLARARGAVTHAVVTRAAEALIKRHISSGDVAKITFQLNGKLTRTQV